MKRKKEILEGAFGEEEVQFFGLELLSRCRRDTVLLVSVALIYPEFVESHVYRRLD